MRSLRLSPSEQVLDVSRGHSLSIMFAVNEPGLDAFAFVHILPDLLGHDVPAGIRRAAVVRSPFAPVDVGEAEAPQKVESEFLEGSVGQVAEVELWHIGTG